jgi:hypothetical protein
MQRRCRVIAKSLEYPPDPAQAHTPALGCRHHRAPRHVKDFRIKLWEGPRQRIEHLSSELRRHRRQLKNGATIPERRRDRG